MGPSAFSAPRGCGAERGEATSVVARCETGSPRRKEGGAPGRPPRAEQRLALPGVRDDHPPAAAPPPPARPGPLPPPRRAPASGVPQRCLPAPRGVTSHAPGRAHHGALPRLRAAESCSGTAAVAVSIPAQNQTPRLPAEPQPANHRSPAARGACALRRARLRAHTFALCTPFRILSARTQCVFCHLPFRHHSGVVPTLK